MKVTKGGAISEQPNVFKIDQIVERKDNENLGIIYSNSPDGMFVPILTLPGMVATNWLKKDITPYQGLITIQND